ncbi:MAG: ECF transporter S component [Firmicutes bacterium]|nr:ECF transporter S component [Bacillota bacterium]
MVEVKVNPGARSIRSKTRNLVWGALFIALGIVLPIAFHAIGAGPVFLPMHIPVLLAGFFAGPATGAAVGFLTPILSAVFTGMPPLMPPVAQMMMVELAVYGFLTGFLYGRLRQNAIISLVCAMFAGRIVYGALGAFILPLFGLKAIPVFYPITLGVVKSLPGILIQLVLIPTVIYLVEGNARASTLLSRDYPGDGGKAGE